MLEFLAEIDRVVFLFVNLTLANPVTDFLMPIVTSDTLLKVLYGTVVLAMLIKGDRKLRWLVVASGLTLLLSDQVSAGLLKPAIGRLRPCHTMTVVHLLVGCGGGKAMPSAHAANVFAQATLFGYHYPRARTYLFSFAALVAISRVFVGVHYPGDVLAGAVLGTAIGLILARAFRTFYRRVLRSADQA
ncbi:MAG TPA: phosphatase PAP2 family protein [Acidobacteriota bacterium]|nr:phosphatase PAP2 family protein [Acidobacteriota bacterium]